MNKFFYCMLTEEFYKNEAKNIKELSDKTNRIYLYITIEYNNLYYLIPFYSKIKNPPAAHYLIPSQTRPEAGLNFEKVVILEDDKHIIQLDHVKMPQSQTNKVENNIEAIENKFKTYINTFKKKCENEKINEDKNYRFSTLKEYKDLLLHDF